MKLQHAKLDQDFKKKIKKNSNQSKNTIVPIWKNITVPPEMNFPLCSHYTIYR